jgi:glutamyl-tRNA(Gln) amidotransferase subunit D
MSPELIRAHEGYKGLVLAGTGLGHISTTLLSPLQKLIKTGTVVVMTSQCMEGRVCDRVYDTGRDLLSSGVIEGGDMLPEVALVKMMWVLGNEKDPEKAAALLQTDLKGECNRRSTHGL